MVTVTRHSLRHQLGVGTYVYAGRPGKWGNPFPMKGEAYRAYVIEQFRTWWYAPEQAALRGAALKEIPDDAVLGCYCMPLPCHCDVIAAFLNGERAKE